MKRFACLCVVFCFGLMYVAQAQVLDQSADGDFFLNTSMGPGYYSAQTYTAGLTGTLASVSLKVFGNAGTTVTVEITDVVSNAPGSTILGTTSVTLTTYPCSPTCVFTQVPFSSPIQQVAGSQYAIVVTTDAPGGWIGNSAGNPYPAGGAFVTTGGMTWASLGGGTDLYFKTFVSPDPGISLSASSLSFDSQTVGTASAPQLLTLSNSGTNNDLQITNIYAEGDFSQTNNCVPPGLVAPGSSCTVTVTFSPNSSGPRSGVITIEDNVPGSPQRVAMAGAATAAVNPPPPAYAWDLSTANGPSPRAGHGLVYDSGRQKVVLFGGQDADGNWLNDTWEFDTASQMWANVTPSSGDMPIPRSDFGMAYDPVRARVVVYGGHVSTLYSNVGITGDTWEWDGANHAWIATSADTIQYVGMWGAQMAFDPNLQKVILFGGQPYWVYPQNGNTYAWDGTNWNLVSSSGPIGRAQLAMTSDSAHSQVILFGGQHWSYDAVTNSLTTYIILGDTWTWNGNAWTQRALSGPSPSPVIDSALAYDNSRAVVTLFGGSNQAGVSSPETWEWNGSAWSLTPTLSSPCARQTAMAYDDSQAQLVLFGGAGVCGRALGDTYLFASTVTATVLTSSPNPSAYGQGVALTATVSPLAFSIPTGTVTFTDGAATLGTASLNNGVATLTNSSLGVGAHNLTATYSGGSNLQPSVSFPVAHTVNQATSATALLSSANPSYVNQAVTFTATVTSQFGGAAGGSVTFKQGATTLSTASLANGQATYSTTYSTAGARSITAIYSGDSSNLGSTSAVLQQMVKPLPAATATQVTTSGTPSFINQAVTFNATVTSTNGPIPDGELVTFSDGVTPLATVPLSAGVAAYSTSALKVATHTIKAAYAGDTTFRASMGTVKQVVSLYPSSMSAPTTTLNPSTYGQSVTFTATVTSSAPAVPTGTVVFKNGTASLGSVSLNASGIATLTKTNLLPGTLSITATYNGDSETAKTTSAALTQAVNQATSATALTSTPNPSTLGHMVKFTVTVTSPTTIPTGPVTFMDGNTPLKTVNLAAGKASYNTTTLTAGSHNITVVYAGTANITGSTSPVLVQTVN